MYRKATEKGWPVFEMEGRVLLPWLSKYSPLNGQYNGTCCYEVVEHNKELKCVAVTYMVEMTDEMAEEVPPTKGNEMIKKWMKDEERVFVNEEREEVMLRVEVNSGVNYFVVDGAKTQALTMYKRSKKSRPMGKEQIRAEKELMEELKAMMTADERDAMRAEVEKEYKKEKEFVYAVNIRMDASRVYGVLAETEIRPDMITCVDGTMRLMFKSGDASDHSENVRNAFKKK